MHVRRACQDVYHPCLGAESPTSSASAPMPPQDRQVILAMEIQLAAAVLVWSCTYTYEFSCGRKRVYDGVLVAMLPKNANGDFKQTQAFGNISNYSRLWRIRLVPDRCRPILLFTLNLSLPAVLGSHQDSRAGKVDYVYPNVQGLQGLNNLTGDSTHCWLGTTSAEKPCIINAWKLPFHSCLLTQTSCYDFADYLGNEKLLENMLCEVWTGGLIVLLFLCV